MRSSDFWCFLLAEMWLWRNRTIWSTLENCSLAWVCFCSWADCCRSWPIWRVCLNASASIDSWRLDNRRWVFCRRLNSSRRKTLSTNLNLKHQQKTVKAIKTGPSSTILIWDILPTRPGTLLFWPTIDRQAMLDKFWRNTLFLNLSIHSRNECWENVNMCGFVFLNSFSMLSNE